MNLLILGAAGGTGRELVRQGIAAGHKVTAFARDPSKVGLADPMLASISGDVTDGPLVARALAGQDAVVSVLANPSTFSRDPGLVGAIDRLVKLMKTSGPSRLLYVSALPVDAGWSRTGLILGLVARTLLRSEMADHKDKEARVRASGLDWTIVRPAVLKDGPGTGRYRAGADLRASGVLPPTMARADLASFLLHAATEAKFMRQAALLLPG